MFGRVRAEENEALEVIPAKIACVFIAQGFRPPFRGEGGKQRGFFLLFPTVAAELPGPRFRLTGLRPLFIHVYGLVEVP